MGETVSFRPDKLGSPVTSFTWKQINSGTVKAIEWDVDDGFSIPNQRFQGITTLDNKTGLITITNLKVEHSGLYTIDINSREHQQRFSLEVMGEKILIIKFININTVKPLYLNIFVIYNTASKSVSFNFFYVL